MTLRRAGSFYNNSLRPSVFALIKPLNKNRVYSRSSAVKESTWLKFDDNHL